MRNSYLTALLSIGVALASLSSCSRANYTFSPAPAYLGSEHGHHSVAVAPATVVSAPSALPELAVANAPAPSLHNAIAAAPVLAGHSQQEGVGSPTARKALVQRILVKSVGKRIAQFQAKQNAAEVAHPASKVGSSALVILAGLVLILLGGLVGVDAIVTIGGVVFVVGLILIILALIRGK
jgi:hypothetical protein